MKLIAITGGIGSGKSVVSDVLRTMGQIVYDCDSEAKTLMERDDEMCHRIFTEVCPEARLIEGGIDRRRLAQAVFSDKCKLGKLNSIVHGAVKSDLLSRASEVPLMFFESAILRSSGFLALADVVWEVMAPFDLRVRRVMLRNSLSRHDVERRIDAQKGETAVGLAGTRVIVNDGVMPVLPQVERYFDELFQPPGC